MSSIESGKGWWIAVPIVLLLLLVALFWPIVSKDDGSSAPVPTVSYIDSAKVTSWDWRADRSGKLFAVWGMVKNESGRQLTLVTLQVRTVDAQGHTIATYPIPAGSLKPGEVKPFREDIPRSGKEDKAFVIVWDVLP